MSGADEGEKKFIIKHVFKDVKNQLNKEAVMLGPMEKHHGVEWKLRLVESNDGFTEYIEFYMDCVNAEQSRDWSIESKFDVFANGKKIEQTRTCTFSKRCRSNDNKNYIPFLDYDEYTKNDEILVEFRVTIKKITGIGERTSRKFDQKSTGKFSDVVLVVGGEKFYVIKHFLAMHSTYFEAMFLGNFAESVKSEIELKEVDPEHFEHFLELIYKESLVNDTTVEGILHLADFFGSEKSIKSCHDFLLKKSKLPLKRKFAAAIKGGFWDVKKQCLSSMKTKEDVKKVLPEDPAHFQPSIWAELLQKSLSLE